MIAAIPVLRTDRLILRAPGPQDLDAMASFYAGPRSRFLGGPMARWECWRYLSEVIGHWSMRGYGRWVLERRDSGAPVGLVGPFHPIDWPEPEIGWMLFNGAEGHGYATEAALAARDYAYDVLGWTTAVSLIDPQNAGSLALAARLDASPDGVYEHPKYGALQIWRHPGPGAVAAARQAGVQA